jgi:acetyl esterase/lipase
MFNPLGRFLSRKALVAVLLFNLIALAGWSQTDATYQRTEDVVYGRKYGMALTMDVLTPAKPNGVGIIYIMSGGWVSSHDWIKPEAFKAFLDRGYTVFAVCHGCQPKFTITEIIPDMHRAVRFIRHNAAKYGIDPKRIGVAGGSAGGHLSLVLGTGLGAESMANSKDPINHESSAVQCVACFFPPTDFLNYGTNGYIAVGTNILKNYRAAFGPRADTLAGAEELGHEISPIYYITTNMPPTLIFHGDADHLVPIQQSEMFAKKARELGDNVKIIVREGKAHGWPDLIAVDMPVAADWFDVYLRGIQK